MKDMTPKEKSLLLKDLSARLSYGTIVSVTDGTIKYEAYIESISYKNIEVSPVSDSNFTAYTFYKISEIKPYLRPMSSMTEEEDKEICQFMKDYNLLPGSNRAGVFCGKIVDWLNAHHFDYRGLIERGLAIEVTKENNPYENL